LSGPGTGGLVLTACGGPSPAAIDLLRAGEGFLEGSVAGEPWDPSADTTPALDEDTLEALRALGYVEP